ncbi:MAG: hypothetical protein IJQ00_12495 [Kiritimatiellae bacterium]|nr:hypothetical protein [Kiritimatiellia bacterium]
MRRFWALARSAALEALAEPLSAILFLVALLAVHLLPVFHLHQFGEAGRLSRECGFSALLVFGLVFATSAAVHAIGRELESGTAAAALARPVPRSMFFCAKVAGVLAAFALFLLSVAGATLLSVVTSQMGRIVTQGDVLVWGPGVAAGAGGTLLAFALAALGNGILRTRFCVGACLLMALAQPVVLAGILFFNHSPVPWTLLPALGVLALGCSVFVVMAGALAVCLKPAAVSALMTVAVLLSFVRPLRAVMPDINRFWLVDAFTSGGTIPARELCAAAGAGALLVAFWLVVGSVLLARREIP